MGNDSPARGGRYLIYAKGPEEAEEGFGVHDHRGGQRYRNTHSFLDKGYVKGIRFDVDIQSVKYYYAVETELGEKLSEIAKAKGISSETLLNLWIKEKIAEERCLNPIAHIR